MSGTKTQRQVQTPSATDLYNIDHLLSEEERMVRDTVRKFVNERVLPIIGEHFEAGTFPRELIPEIAGLGLLGMHLEGYGCAGLSAVCYGLACQELEAGDSGLRSFVSVQGSLAMFPISAFGSEEQKQHWLPRMARGEVIGCFGLTEPDSGSDPSSMRTTARRDGDSFVLNEARYGIAWGATGAARACYEVALDYAKTRIQFNRPIASFQLVQQKLAIMATELVKAQLLSLQVGRLKDEGLLHPVQISIAKRNNVREALRTAREARSVLGANGITLEYPISRHSNNLESVYTYEGTDDIHTLIIGQAITGQNAFS